MGRGGKRPIESGGPGDDQSKTSSLELGSPFAEYVLEELKEREYLNGSEQQKKAGPSCRWSVFLLHYRRTGA